MAIVTQETILFNDTVWNNICYGRPGLRKNAWKPRPRRRWRMTLFWNCRRAIRRCSATAGRDSAAGSGSASPSRAQFEGFADPILDEATSELDSESEMLVQRALSNLMTGRTAFVIAHRLSTIRRADKIIVLEDGSIAEVARTRSFWRGAARTRVSTNCNSRTRMT